jgi:hypothetical protein
VAPSAPVISHALETASKTAVFSKDHDTQNGHVHPCKCPKLSKATSMLGTPMGGALAKYLNQRPPAPVLTRGPAREVF